MILVCLKWPALGLGSACFPPAQTHIFSYIYQSTNVRIKYVVAWILTFPLYIFNCQCDISKTIPCDLNMTDLNSHAVYLSKYLEYASQVHFPGNLFLFYYHQYLKY
jgi:hypothetical protein